MENNNDGNPREFNIPDLFNGILKLSKKVGESFLKNSSSYLHDNRDIILSYSNFLTKIAISPQQVFKIQNIAFTYFAEQQQAFQKIFFHGQTNDHQAIVPNEGDKRFTSPEWTEIPYFNFIKQNYLLFEKLWDKIIDEVEIEERERRKLEFYSDQYVNFFSPANFLVTNPVAIKLAIETKGQSLWNGFNNLVHDVENGKIRQTDESAFEVGGNLAITKGAVIFENELIQLIQYSPLTEEVYETPLLIIPPMINKYYILDLQPKSSFVKYFIEKGFTVFIISWRNPEPGMGYISMDDYLSKGVLMAVEIIEEISHSRKLNLMGYCIGGTLMSIAASILASKEKPSPINYATFVAAMVDFSDVGPMGNVINSALVRRMESGELLTEGVLPGHDMERAFNLIRANDLVWKYVVESYLEGKKPSAFDVMYWTNDNTNLPSKMYLYYLRNMVLDNLLRVKNALRICDTPIDIGKIEIPVCIVGFTEDYISPAETVFNTSKLVSGPVEFILGGSGHVMGTINHPSKNKYGYYVNGKLGKSLEEWKNTASYFEGSWWKPWSESLKKHSGKKIQSSPEPGSEKYSVIEPAPGSYVKEEYKD